MPSSPDPSAPGYALPPALTERLLSPALIVYLDVVRANIRTVLAHLGNDPNRWRPHVKTIKIPAVQAELVHAGVRQFKCATPREADCVARVLDAAGCSGDVLLAYPLVGPGLERLAEVARSYPRVRFSVLVESPEAARETPEPLGLFVDVNGGMDRTGIPLSRADSIDATVDAAGPRLRGLHAYDGNRNEADPLLRTQALERSYAALEALVRRQISRGHSVPELITAGTPAFLDAARTRAFGGLAETLHRVSPGTVVLHDLRSAEENPGLDLAPAALVFSRVVSHPGSTRATCDAGSKSVAAEAGDPIAAVLGHPDWLALPPSEEHLPLEIGRGALPARGTELLLVPRHVCPTVNLAEHAVLIESGQPPRIAAVEARAHEILLGSVSTIDTA